MALTDPTSGTSSARLPTGWRNARVADFGTVVTGGTPSTSVKRYWNGAHPWITPTDIGLERDMFESERLLTDAGLQAIRRLPPDSVLVTCIASIGKNAILKRIGGCNQQINAIIPTDAYDPRFIYYLFEANKSLLLTNAGTTATPILSKGAFQELTFASPARDEQQAIADALSDADALLGGLGTLIEKKHGLKQATMQQLLSGKRRLPGFSDEWTPVTLGSQLERLANGAVYQPSSREGVPITRIETIAAGAVDYSRTGLAKWSPTLEKHLLQRGDILFSHINSIEHIGKVALVADSRPLYHGMNLLLLRASPCNNPAYLFYWMSSGPARRHMRALAKQAVSQASINTSELRAVTLRLPPREEQDAIAAALADMDAEISALEQRRDKTRLLKQGMMQELLTGRTRLV